MIVFYTLIVLHSFYSVILITINLINKSIGTVQKSQTQEIINNSNATHTATDSSISRPSYKKNNLSIDIPNLSTDNDDIESKFIKQYYKDQCFPMLLFSYDCSKISKNARVTIWFTLMTLEIYVNSLIMIHEAFALTSAISCLISSPLNLVLTLIFRITNTRRMIIVGLGYGFAFCIIGIVFGFSVFVVVDNISIFVVSTVFVVLFEMILMEPFRTLVKAVGFLVFKDLGMLVNFCEGL